MSPNVPPTGEPTPLPSKETVEALHGKKMAGQYVEAKTDERRRAMLAALARREREDGELREGFVEYVLDGEDDERRGSYARKILRAKAVPVEAHLEDLDVLYDTLETLCEHMERELSTNESLSPDEFFDLAEKNLVERAKMHVIAALIVHGSCMFKDAERTMRKDMAFAGVSSETILGLFASAIGYLRQERWISFA